MTSHTKWFAFLVLGLLVGGCGGGGNATPGATLPYPIVMMVPDWAPLVDTTPLNGRKQSLARYDQAEATTRAFLEQFVEDLGYPDAVGSLKVLERYMAKPGTTQVLRTSPPYTWRRSSLHRTCGITCRSSR